MDTLGRRKANDTIGHYRCLPKREPGYVSQVSLGTNISEGVSSFRNWVCLTLFIFLQMWMYSKTMEIISLENCLDASVSNPDSKAYKPIKLFPCHKLGGNQLWHYSPVS